nr:WYL domain-containing protein [uncultured Blautia sp.]
MAKSRNQKAKILVLEHLLEETGENRAVTMQEILEKMAEYGINAERKSIYDDLDALRDFGLDVKYKRGRPGGYYLAGQKAEEKKELTPKPAARQTKEQAQPVVKEILVKHFVLDESEIQDAEKPMKLLCRDTREKAIREYFGTYGSYKNKEAGYISVTVPQISGPQFFGWLTAMGRDVTIVKPKKTAAAYRDYLKLLAKEYKGI